jgi:hypothetical protein
VVVVVWQLRGHVSANRRFHDADLRVKGNAQGVDQHRKGIAWLFEMSASLHGMFL